MLEGLKDGATRAYECWNQNRKAGIYNSVVAENSVLSQIFQTRQGFVDDADRPYQVNRSFPYKSFSEENIEASLDHWKNPEKHKGWTNRAKQAFFNDTSLGFDVDDQMIITEVSGHKEQVKQLIVVDYKNLRRLTKPLKIQKSDDTNF